MGKRPFLVIATNAFPYSCKELAQEEGKALLPLVDESYRTSSIEVIVPGGGTVQIPQRIHFAGMKNLTMEADRSLIAQCLLTRSTDGYIRHEAVRHLLRAKETWCIPFVVLLAGEYVVEIISDLTGALPDLDRYAYVDFVRNNRKLMTKLRAKAGSYWNCYYRGDFLNKSTYPGLVFLLQLDAWAS
jgi:hypothetical protein